MNHARSLRRLAIVAAACVTLAACNRSGDVTDQASAPSEKTDATTAPVGMDQPLDKSQVGATYTVDAAGVRLRAGNVVRIPVRVTNTGKTTLLSKGAYPVRLGTQLVGADGTMMRRDFVRTPIGELASGQSADLVVEVPAKEVTGNSVRFDLVQEKVNWFSAMGVATTDFGPFTACADDAAALCGPDGKAIANQ